MPYITEARRKELEVDPYASKVGGDLNYVMTALIITRAPKTKAHFSQFFDAYWKTHEQRYATINDIGGAVLNCAMEFQRRAKINNYRWDCQAMAEAYVEWYNTIAGPYEDTKIQENGDVFK